MYLINTCFHFRSEKLSDLEMNTLIIIIFPVFQQCSVTTAQSTFHAVTHVQGAARGTMPILAARSVSQ